MAKVISIKQVQDSSDSTGPDLQDLLEAAIEGRTILNKMCSSLVKTENRRRFRAFPEGYCREYGLSLEQIHAVTDLDILRLLDLGATRTNLERLTGIYGLSAIDLCMEQTGKDQEEVRRLFDK